ATDLIPHYIGSSQVKIGDSPLCRRRKACCPSLLCFTRGSVAFYGYHPMPRRCSTDASNPLKENFA
ncbi:hypothetical protein HAX54_001803, partial [Datura stramonium]|nr:hypothetical protein [Datura stramonium]